jgi:hypothetical protein
MKIKKVQFSTVISDLWGRDGYQSHIEVGREYWYYFGENTQAYKLTHKHWNKLKITYVRSGCLFFTLPDAPDFEEEFCPIKCFMTSQFVLAEIDPIKDIGLDMLGNLEAAKIKYCFNDEHTIVNNWSNEKEIEIDEDELFNKFGKSEDTNMLAEYLYIKALEKRDT